MKPKLPKIPKPPKPPKKSALQKRIEDVSSGYWKKLADRAWSDLIHTWYISCAVNDWRCSGPLEAHHVINRARLATRHDPKCGCLLCSHHHQWSADISAHIGSLAFAEWLQINRPRQWEWACEHKFDANPEKPDYKAAMERLIKLKADYLAGKESLRAKQ
jgi:hypothetical protein